MFLSSRETEALLKMKTTSLYELRRRGEFVEGIHFVRAGSRKLLYIEDAVRNWALNRNDSVAHAKWIIDFRKKASVA